MSAHTAISETRGAYDPASVEAKWQSAWREQGAFAAPPPADGRADAAVFVAPLRDSAELTFAQARACVLADVVARYRRGRGDAVLSALALEDLAPARAELERLGLSVDWSRSFRFNDPAVRRWTQWLAERLRSDGVIEQAAPDGPALLRLSRFHDDNHAALAGLGRWSDEARAWQAAALQPLDGVELRAEGIDGTALPVFTRHADMVDKGALVVLSPSHPDIDSWVRSDAARSRLHAPDGVATGLFAWVPGPDKLLPVCVHPQVTALIGPSAMLAIPKTALADAELLRRFADVGQATYAYRGRRSKPTPVTRCLAPDPVLDEAFLTAAVSWALLAADRSQDELDGEALARWTADSTLVAAHDDADTVLGMRTVAKVLAAGEPFGRVALVAESEPDGAPAPGELVKDAGADAVRLALFMTAAGHPLTWNGEALVHAGRLLDRLWAFAAPRIARDGAAAPGAPRPRGTRWLRRLDRWCAVATTKITENYEALDAHRAVRNVQALLERIEAFEEGAGPDDDPDGVAVASALLLLVELASPLAPHIAAELAERSGRDAPQA